ncbi:MAG: NAD(P) transhydrogenase subunit alpha, partial [bacterium]|nr:NAD(P) transhydrogenase subunit alpha [bacterium]
PKETFPGERRVALAPSALGKLAKAGIEVHVEAGAGAAAGISDDDFTAKGAKVATSRQELFSAAEVILQVRSHGSNPEAGREDLSLLRASQAVIGFCDPLSVPKLVEEVAATGATAFSMEMMPRITRAQSMDALSSMATIAGYKAVVLAADRLSKMFPMLMTAAGTVAPAKVLIIGVGVAGLQAIATARRLGGVVTAYDVRPAVKEQVESLGAKFLELDLETSGAEDKGGYAKGQSEDFLKRQREAMGRALAEMDVVITTAAVPGKKAPLLVTRQMVEGMSAGSIVVDIAAERGGNCEVTRPGEDVDHQGVTILGPLNLASTIPTHASQMYARNISTFLLHMTMHVVMKNVLIEVFEES